MSHKHAAAMAEYAKDATETNTPWERWEFSYQNQEFEPVAHHPTWDERYKYRRKVKTIMINGYEVPEPQRVPLAIDEPYWTFYFFQEIRMCKWKDDDYDKLALEKGFVHTSKEAAVKHFDALISFTAR